MSTKLTKQALEKLAKEVNEDQARSSSAEKRGKIDTTFKKAVKKMGRTLSSRKKP